MVLMKGLTLILIAENLSYLLISLVSVPYAQHTLLNIRECMHN